MKDTTVANSPQFQCRHIFTGGLRCGSRAQPSYSRVVINPDHVGPNRVPIPRARKYRLLQRFVSENAAAASRENIPRILVC